MLSLIDLPGWERERVADALVLLTFQPRPRGASGLELEGEALEIAIGERSVRYKVYKDDEDHELVIVVFRII